MSEELSKNNSLIRVKVSLMLPPIAGIEKAGFVLSLENGNITEVFDRIYEQYPQLDPDSPQADLTASNVFWISLNGMMVNFSREKNPSLKSGDELVIMMPLAGG